MVDISLIGAGLELVGDTEGIRIGTRLVVEAGSQTAFFLRFAGEVRRIDCFGGGDASVGIEFVNASETERYVLTVMEHLGVFEAWSAPCTGRLPLGGSGGGRPRGRLIV